MMGTIVRLYRRGWVGPKVEVGGFGVRWQGMEANLLNAQRTPLARGQMGEKKNDRKNEKKKKPARASDVGLPSMTFGRMPRPQGLNIPIGFNCLLRISNSLSPLSLSSLPPRPLEHLTTVDHCVCDRSDLEILAIQYLCANSMLGLCPCSIEHPLK